MLSEISLKEFELIIENYRKGIKKDLDFLKDIQDNEENSYFLAQALSNPTTSQYTKTFCMNAISSIIEKNKKIIHLVEKVVSPFFHDNIELIVKTAYVQTACSKLFYRLYGDNYPDCAFRVTQLFKTNVSIPLGIAIGITMLNSNCEISGFDSIITSGLILLTEDNSYPHILHSSLELLSLYYSVLKSKSIYRPTIESYFIVLGFERSFYILNKVPIPTACLLIKMILDILHCVNVFSSDRAFLDSVYISLIENLIRIDIKLLNLKIMTGIAEMCVYLKKVNYFRENNDTVFLIQFIDFAHKCSMSSLNYEYLLKEPLSVEFFCEFWSPLKQFAIFERDKEFSAIETEFYNQFAKKLIDILFSDSTTISKFICNTDEDPSSLFYDKVGLLLSREYHNQMELMKNILVCKYEEKSISVVIAIEIASSMVVSHQFSGNMNSFFIDDFSFLLELYECINKDDGSDHQYDGLYEGNSDYWFERSIIHFYLSINCVYLKSSPFILGQCSTEHLDILSYFLFRLYNNLQRVDLPKNMIGEIMKCLALECIPKVLVVHYLERYPVNDRFLINGFPICYHDDMVEETKMIIKSLSYLSSLGHPSITTNDLLDHYLSHSIHKELTPWVLQTLSFLLCFHKSEFGLISEQIIEKTFPKLEECIEMKEYHHEIACFLKNFVHSYGDRSDIPLMSQEAYNNCISFLQMYKALISCFSYEHDERSLKTISLLIDGMNELLCWKSVNFGIMVHYGDDEIVQIINNLFIKLSIIESAFLYQEPLIRSSYLRFINTLFNTFTDERIISSDTVLIHIVHMSIQYFSCLSLVFDDMKILSSIILSVIYPNEGFINGQKSLIEDLFCSLIIATQSDEIPNSFHKLLQVLSPLCLNSIRDYVINNNTSVSNETLIYSFEIFSSFIESPQITTDLWKALKEASVIIIPFISPNLVSLSD